MFLLCEASSFLASASWICSAVKRGNMLLAVPIERIDFDYVRALGHGLVAWLREQVKRIRPSNASVKVRFFRDHAWSLAIRTEAIPRQARRQYHKRGRRRVLRAGYREIHLCRNGFSLPFGLTLIRELTGTEL
jgi:hypothetical protein